jgi:hypothetical protein
MFRFQAAFNVITRHPEEAIRSLDAAINDGEQALDDCRNAVQDLMFGPIAKGAVQLLSDRH